MTFTRAHHKAIIDILSTFDSTFLRENNILFGGGTRIALELNEFRESVDIDLFCIGKAAYRAARSSITNSSFGPLLRPGKTLKRLDNRDIRADRDAIRAALDGPERPIKLEIIHFSNDRILPDTRPHLFPVPCISPEGCFATKLTANADRYASSIKDILDLCMMRREWGDIPPTAWEFACEEYGENVILSGLRKALLLLNANHEANLNTATRSLHIDPGLAKELIKELAPSWLAELPKP